MHSVSLPTKQTTPLSKALKISTLLIATLGSTYLQAEGFGIFEARGLAMGGTVVASANTDNAQFYNPALLSFHDGDEDKTKDGSFYFPSLTTQLSQSIEDAYNIEDDELDQRLTDSIDAFNVNASVGNANTVLASSRELLDAIDSLNDQDVFADGFTGMSMSLPGDREGGGFYVGARAVGGGITNISDEDLALLNDYIDALTFISSGGVEGSANPQLFNIDGSLIDPVNTLTSTARAKGATIVEFGISASKEYELWGIDVAFGITPKLMKVRTYEAALSLNSGSIDTESSEQDFISGNFDVGMAMELASSETSSYRIGLAVKDVETKSFDTELGNSITLRAKPRLGLAYVSNRFQLGLDADLNRVSAVGDERATQEVSLGGEVQLMGKLFLRGGYRHDLRGAREDIASVGLGFHATGFLFDIAYANSGDSEGVSLQLGFRH